jgi:hypothetical protein
MRSAAEGRNRLPAALASGAIAIFANSLTLRAADLLGIDTARGGLLRLLTSGLVAALPRTPSGADMATQLRKATAAGGVQTTFHFGVGLLMAVAYACACEPWASRRPISCGLVCGALVWLANAFWVLPAAGEGVAGAAHLTWLGMAWFAAAHAPMAK